MRDPGHAALGAWSGGRFMHFGQALEPDRLTALLTPGDDVPAVLTADVYGQGEADGVVGRALAASGRAREEYWLAGAVGHDFYAGARAGARGFPRFTDPSLRGPDAYAGYLREATERSLERLGVDHFDLLLLHNPDRTGYTDERVWAGMAALRDDGLTRRVGVAPGPANGFTLDVLACLERFGDLIDWAMLILNPLEPWPGELVLPAAEAKGVRVIARVVDYGGLFWDDVHPGHEFAPGDHRVHRPGGWVEAGRERMDRMRPLAARHGLSMLGLAGAWCLAHPAVSCLAPTLIQEPGPDARPVECKRAELAAVPPGRVLDAADIEEIRAIGDNTGGMALKGAAPDFEGEERPDRWPLTPELAELGRRWGIEPERDLSPAA